MDGAGTVSLNAGLALYGLVGANLYRLTADFRNDRLTLQWVVRKGISEDEVEDYRCVGTELISHFHSATIDEQFVEVTGLGAVNEVPQLPIPLFCRNLTEGSSKDV